MALSAVRGERTLVQLAEQFDVHGNQSQDLKKLIGSAEENFGQGAAEAEFSAEETQKLNAKIGQLTMVNDFLSKTVGRDR